MDEVSVNAEANVYPHWPDLTIADLKFTCIQNPNDMDARQSLKEAIIKNSMVLLNMQCKDEIAGWDLEQEVITRIEEDNNKTLIDLDKAIQDAEENLGVSEIRSALMAKIEFLCRTGDFQAASKCIKESLTKKAMAALSSKLDLKIYQLRCLLFELKDPEELRRIMTEAKKILEESGSADWDRKNRLKIYEALVAFHTMRDFTTATRLFLETLPTYNCYEILSHKTFISYTVLFGMISLVRPDLRDKVVKNSEIRQVLFSEPMMRHFLNSLFECSYGEFFLSLADIEQRLKKNRFWFPHYRHYISELKIIAYNQHLESYSSLSLKSMADAFGIGEIMIDRDLSKLIHTGRLNCKIDKVNGHVNALRPDEKNISYQDLIKKGDMLLTRIQKLSRVISL